jgi:hypothetical protein
MKKLFWIIRNATSVIVQSLFGGTGALGHKEDARDKVYAGSLIVDRQKDSSFDTGLRLDQNPFNVCVFYSRTTGRSMQNGIRFSARWDIKVARKNGWLTGNGWSYLRAENDIGKHIGLIPYELMPDEIGFMSWDEYSKWTEEDERLLEVASHFKVPNYSRVFTKSGAVSAISEKKALFTAGKWYYAMNRPQPSRFLLEPAGGFVGNHAYCLVAYRDYGDDFLTPQTFGDNFGDKGAAWVDNIFGPGQFAIYTEDSLSAESIAYYLKKFRQYGAIKGSGPAIYLIYENEKCPFTSWEAYEKWCIENGKETKNFITVSDDALALIADGRSI